MGLVCDYQSPDGWGTSSSESELIFTAQGQPTAVAPNDDLRDPHLQFQCRLELRIPAYRNVIFRFMLDVDQYANCDFLHQGFELGRANIFSEGPVLELYYNAWEHGE